MGSRDTVNERARIRIAHESAERPPGCIENARNSRLRRSGQLQYLVPEHLPPECRRDVALDGGNGQHRLSAATVASSAERAERVQRPVTHEADS